MSARTKGPDLKRYLDKRLSVKLNGQRNVSGVLRGYDKYMNIVLDDATEERSVSERVGMGQVIIRGNTIIELECLEAQRLPR